MKRQMCRGTIGAIACLYALILLAGKGWAQDTWTWQQQCDSNEWRAICSIPDPADCGYDEYDNPIHRYLNNWGHSRCGERPGLPGPGSICIFPMGANARLNGSIDVLNISINNGATFSWQEGLLILRNPSDNSSGKLTNAGLLRMVRDPSPPTYRYLSGVLENSGTLIHEAGDTAFYGATLVNSGTLIHEAGDTAFYGATLVNSGTLIHEAGSTYFHGATLENRATAEVRAGRWSHYSGTNRVVNTGTLNKTTIGSFSITVPMEQANATVSVQAGTLNLSGNSNTHQTVSWSVASGASLVLTGTHTFGGTHSGAIEGTLIQYDTVQAGSNGATFNFTGTGYQWQIGTLNGGSAGLTNAGLLRIVRDPSPPTYRYLSGVLVNSGTLIHEAGDTVFRGATLVNSGTLIHEADSTYFHGATLENRATAEVRAGGWSHSSGTNRVVNTGTLNKTTIGSFSITVPMEQANATVSVQAGTLNLSGNSNTHQTVSWSVASGASLALTLYSTHTFGGTHSGAIEGALIQYGTVQAGSNGATFNFTGTGYQWQSGTLNGGSAGLTNAGLLRMVGRSSLYLSGVLVNSGTLIHEAGSTYFQGATLENRATAEVRAGGWSHYSGTNRVVNTGTLNKTTIGSFSITVPMEQANATVNVQAGELSIWDASHQTVSWSVASGASLVLTGTHTFGGTHSGAIEGTLIQYDTVQAGSNGATFNFTGTGYQWQSGTLNGGSAGLTNAGLLRIVGDYGRYLSGVLVNAGTLIHEAGSTYFQGATLENRATAEVRAGGWSHSSGTNRVVNTGTLRKVLPAPNNPNWFDIIVNTTNSGRIDVQNGTLSVSHLTQTAGEVRIHRMATLSVSNPLAMQGGALTGAGRLSGALNNTGGTIAPGIDDPDQPNLNPLGILTISGNLTLGADAAFEVELAGIDNSDSANPQYDQVILETGRTTPTVQLNGTLRVKGRDGYTPAMGDTFDILVHSGSSWNRTGAFHTVEVDADTLPCVAFEVQYLADRVRLVVTRVPGSADINGDGCVDDADLLAVLFAFGQTGSNLAEDINCDGVVDNAELLSVLFAFGNGC